MLDADYDYAVVFTRNAAGYPLVNQNGPIIKCGLIYLLAKLAAPPPKPSQNGG